MRHLGEGGALLEQTTAQQAVAAKLVVAVALQRSGRLAGDVKDLALLHERGGLIERLGVGLGHGRAAAGGEVGVEALAESVALAVGRLAQVDGAEEVGRRLAVAERDRSELRPQERGIAGVEAAALAGR